MDMESKDEKIKGLMATLDEQEATMKMQDEVIDSKEMQIHTVTKEMLEWKIKYQDLSDVELEKTNLDLQLKSAADDRNRLQVTVHSTAHIPLRYRTLYRSRTAHYCPRTAHYCPRTAHSTAHAPYTTDHVHTTDHVPHTTTRVLYTLLL